MEHEVQEGLKIAVSAISVLLVVFVGLLLMS